HVHRAADGQRAPAAGVTSTIEVVSEGGLDTAVAVDGVEARIGIEVPHVEKIAHVQVGGVDGGGSDERRRTVEVEPSGGNVEAALAFFGVKFGKIDGERMKANFAGGD